MEPCEIFAKFSHFSSAFCTILWLLAAKRENRRKYCEQKSVKRMWVFLCDLVHSFTTNAKLDKIRCLFNLNAFIVLLNHTKFRSPKWRLNNNFSRQGEKAGRIGDRIGRNFEPWFSFLTILWTEKTSLITTVCFCIPFSTPMQQLFFSL